MIGLYPKGQFLKNTAYLERGMPYFAFLNSNAEFVKKIDSKRTGGVGDFEPLSQTGSPTGFGDFCHQKSRVGSGSQLPGDG